MHLENREDLAKSSIVFIDFGEIFPISKKSSRKTKHTLIFHEIQIFSEKKQFETLPETKCEIREDLDGK